VVSGTWRRPADRLARRQLGALEGYHDILCAPASLPRDPLFFGPRNNGCVLSSAIGHTEVRT